MDFPESVTDVTAWRAVAAYFDAWSRRDREAWLKLLHPELEFRPTALVATGVVYQGIDEAAGYFDELIAGDRAERARVVRLRRLAPDRFLVELELLIDERAVASACITAQLRDGKFVDTRGYLSDARLLAFTGVVPEDAPVISKPDPSEMS